MWIVQYYLMLIFEIKYLRLIIRQLVSFLTLHSYVIHIQHDKLTDDSLAIESINRILMNHVITNNIFNSLLVSHNYNC